MLELLELLDTEDELLTLLIELEELEVELLLLEPSETCGAGGVPKSTK